MSIITPHTEPGRSIPGRKDNTMKTYQHEYIITSERADRRNDEAENTFCSDNVYEAGQIIILDGLRWHVDRVVR